MGNITRELGKNMKEIPKKDDQRMIKDRFSISADELEDRMQRQTQLHKEPVQRAVALLEAALDKVLTKLGVDVSDPDSIPDQQEDLGIMITEETRPEMAGLQGFFVFVTHRHELIPYCWIGAARLNSVGECYVDIQYFMDNRLEKTGGIKLVGG